MANCEVEVTLELRQNPADSIRTTLSPSPTILFFEDRSFVPPRIWHVGNTEGQPYIGDGNKKIYTFDGPGVYRETSIKGDRVLTVSVRPTPIKLSE